MADTAVLPIRLQKRVNQNYEHRIDQLLHEAKRIINFSVSNNSQEAFRRSTRPVRSAYRDLIRKKDDLSDELLASHDLSKADKAILLERLSEVSWKMSKLWHEETKKLIKIFKRIK